MQTTRETIEREEDSGSSRPTDMMEPVINRNSEVAALTDGTQRKKKKKTFYLLSRRAKTLSAPFLFAVGLGAYVCLYIFHAGVVEDGRDRGPLHDLLYIWIFILVLLTQWLRARTDGAGMPGGNERLALQENVGSSPFFFPFSFGCCAPHFPSISIRRIPPPTLPMCWNICKKKEKTHPQRHRVRLFTYIVDFPPWRRRRLRASSNRSK